MKTLPERLEAVHVSDATSKETGAKRQVWRSVEGGVTLVVTWAPPYMDIGIQQFTCKDLPGYQFTNYEALRKAYAEYWSKR